MVCYTKRMKRRAYGFTIVELIIVVMVIAILAAVSYVAYTNISQELAIISGHRTSLPLLKP